jgi:hypothetical protein
MFGLRRIVFGAALALLSVVPAAAQDPVDDTDSSRVIDIELTPTARAQIAVWIERADGTFMDTLALTQATAYRGIGNRPGATQMNSGFRWPYGRREGVLPVWGHRRASASGAELFPRVIFQDRISEGHASRSSNDFSRDDYYCLSFDVSTTRREALDAVSCASVFNSDKGRYLVEDDVRAGYSEPFAEGSSADMRPLELGSVYPPRRDALRCDSTGCNDHPDVARFDSDVREIMPNIDAVTMATPPGDTLRRIQYDVPDAWLDGDYVLFVEVNIEGDYNDEFNDLTYPTPTTPSGTWDYWAQNYGYPYRGQPSVVYSVPFTLGPAGGAWSTADPAGYGDVNGVTGTMEPMSIVISNDPSGAPGSGADRLRRMADSSRVRVGTIATNVCAGEDPPPECGVECNDTSPCANGFICAPDNTCIGFCDLDMPPRAISGLEIVQHEDIKNAHRWATLSFVAPERERDLARYEVRYGTSPIVDEDTFMRAQPAFAADIDSVELSVPTDGEPGDLVEVSFGGLQPESTYYVGVRAVDMCNDRGPVEVAEITTAEIHFTTVTPCFVATAAWGSPMASEIGTLRRFRDRHLMTNTVGRALVDAYHAVGPHAADVIRDDDTLRSIVRTALTPVLRALTWLED